MTQKRSIAQQIAKHLADAAAWDKRSAWYSAKAEHARQQAAHKQQQANEAAGVQ